MAIKNIILEAANVCWGVLTAYGSMPETLENALPCIVVYDKSCDQVYPRSPMQKQLIHEIYVNLYYAQGTDLAAVDNLLKDFIDPVYEAFNQHITLNGTCTDSAIIHHDYVYVSYGGARYVGIQFTLQAIESVPYTYHS